MAANNYKSLISAVRTVALEGAYPELKALHNEIVEALEMLVKQRDHQEDLYQSAIAHVNAVGDENKRLQGRLDDLNAEKESRR